MPPFRSSRRWFKGGGGKPVRGWFRPSRARSGKRRGAASPPPSSGEGRGCARQHRRASAGRAARRLPRAPGMPRGRGARRERAVRRKWYPSRVAEAGVPKESGIGVGGGREALGRGGGPQGGGGAEGKALGGGGLGGSSEPLGRRGPSEDARPQHLSLKGREHHGGRKVARSREAVSGFIRLVTRKHVRFLEQEVTIGWRIRKDPSKGLGRAGGGANPGSSYAGRGAGPHR